MSEKLLADFACLEPIYVDGIEKLLNFGTSFGILYYRWVAVRSEGGQTIYEKTPALHIRRPRSSLIACRSCDFAKMIDQAGNPTDSRATGLH